MTDALERFKPWLYPSIIGIYHNRQLPFLLGNVPTVDQSFYIAVVVILNIVFLTIGYKTAWPNQTNQWYTNRYQELMAYFIWRTGVLAFCNIPAGLQAVPDHAHCYGGDLCGRLLVPRLYRVREHFWL
jgi:hypothetical protein